MILQEKKQNQKFSTGVERSLMIFWLQIVFDPSFFTASTNDPQINEKSGIMKTGLFSIILGDESSGTQFDLSVITAQSSDIAACILDHIRGIMDHPVGEEM